MEILTIFEALSQELNKNKDKLNELDGIIVDADFGSNITRGFEEVVKKGHTHFVKDSPLSEDLRTTGMTLMAKVGGSSGILLGKAVMAMGDQIKDKHDLKNSDLERMLRAAITMITRLGKAVPGDKTLLDALEPACNAFASVKDNEPIAFKYAAVAARKGAEDTINMVSKRGRSSYLGERSIGHMDAGALAVALIFEKLASMKI